RRLVARLSPTRCDVSLCRSRIADQGRSRRSSPPASLCSRVELQCVPFSSDDSQTNPVGNPLQRSVPGSASVLPVPPGPGLMESTIVLPCLPPWVFPPSVAVWVDMSAPAIPHEVGPGIHPGPQLQSPRTSPRQHLGRRRWPSQYDRLREASLVCRRGHTTLKSAKTVQSSP